MEPDPPADDYGADVRSAICRTARIEGDAERLLSPEKSAAVSGSFGALAQTMLAQQNSRTLEDVVAEMLQPMLKSWLDDNLPVAGRADGAGGDRAGLARPALECPVASCPACAAEGGALPMLQCG